MTFSGLTGIPRDDLCQSFVGKFIVTTSLFRGFQFVCKGGLRDLREQLKALSNCLIENSKRAKRFA
jgi:hypothetical protein